MQKYMLFSLVRWKVTVPCISFNFAFARLKSFPRQMLFLWYLTLVGARKLTILSRMSSTMIIMHFATEASNFNALTTEYWYNSSFKRWPFTHVWSILDFCACRSSGLPWRRLFPVEVNSRYLLTKLHYLLLSYCIFN